MLSSLQNKTVLSRKDTWIHQQHAIISQQSSSAIDEKPTCERQGSFADPDHTATENVGGGNYSSSKPIPYIKSGTLVFPEAGEDISQSHKDRFPVLVDLFRRNVQQYPYLNRLVGLISYELRMCGLSETDARPSILIFCPKSGLSKLKAALTKPHLKAQYDPPSSEQSDHLVRFKLFFWAQNVELLSSAMIQYQPSACSLPASSLCGLRVMLDHGVDKQYSTLACTLYIENQGYGLTTGHLIPGFGDAANETGRNPLSNPDGEIAHDGTENTDDDVSDDEYDLEFETDESDLQKPDLPRSLPTISVQGAAEEVHASSHANRGGSESKLAGLRCKVRGPLDSADWKGNYRNLDWALLQLDDERFWLPNVYSHPETSRPVTVSAISQQPQSHRKVHIVTSPGASCVGHMTEVAVYLQGSFHLKPTRIWTIGRLSDADASEFSALRL